jgi:integrase
VRQRAIPENPFQDLKAPSQVNKARLFDVTREMAGKLLEACPNAEWRLIIALARYGGLRVPSELPGLEWSAVDWERGRFLVKSPKTEHHPNGAERWVPIFPELYGHLRAAFEAAAEGANKVIARGVDTSTNLRTGLLRIIKRAGLKPWEKLFVNMRSTRETELAREHPIHLVCAWIGNSERIAAQHYLQVTEADFARASTQRAAESAAPRCKNAAASPRTGSQATGPETTEAQVPPGFVSQALAPGRNADGCGIPPRGLEPLSSP